MPWTPVPETAVHKYRETHGAKDKVRPAQYRRMTSPIRDPMPPEHSRKCKLRILVPASADA